MDGRYSTANSSDLRPEALESFIAEAVALTRTLAKDPFRSLPDPKLYEGQAKLDLQLEDPKYAAVTPEERRRTVKEIEAAARNVKGNEAIISVTTNFSDTLSESWRVASNGFSGGQRGTNFFMSAEVSAKEADGRKPEDYAYAGARFFRELPEVTSVGREAAERTIRFIGSKKADSAVLTMVLENRAAGRMMAFLQSLAAANKASVKLESLGKTLERRDIWMVQIANPGGAPAAERPGILIAANFEGDHVYGSELAPFISVFLAKGGSNPNVKQRLDNFVYYIVPRVNPDGAEAMGAPLKWARRTNARPYDDDNDGRIDAIRSVRSQPGR